MSSENGGYPGVPDDSDGLYLGDEEDGWPRVTGRGRRAAIVATVVCVAVVAVPLGLVAASGGGSPSRAVGSTTTDPPAPNGGGVAEQTVLAALNATTAAGNFDMSYRVSATVGAATAPSTTTTTACHQVRQPVSLPPGMASPMGMARGYVTYCSSGPAPAPASVPFSGSGTIDVNPYAMVASSTVVGGVTVRVNPTTVWEDLGHADPTLAPPADLGAGAGQPLSGFAGLVESTLGTREGAVAMMAMASPTGYLDLYQQEITGATPSGTGTVDGQAVTYYTVVIDPSHLANPPGASAEEIKTVAAALRVLKDQGFTGSAVEVGIGSSGYILRSTSTARFTDGGTVILDSTFSTFGCAGTVLMPGQHGPTAAVAGCVSPVPSPPTTAQSAPTTVAVPTTSPPTTSPASTSSSTTS